MAPPPTALRDTTRAQDAAATPYARALVRWAQAFGRREIARAVRDPAGYLRTTKARGDVNELVRLLRLFGVRWGRDVSPALLGGQSVADAVAGKPVRVRVFQQWIEGRLALAQGIAASIQERIRESVRTIVAESRADRATVGEVTRRIATQVHAVEPEDGPEQGRVYAFSFARAETIARTELSQVENTARAAEFDATGEPGDEYEWLAYTDGRSGDRHHERMHRVRIPAGGRFETPLGNSVRYPGDPLAPIEETANCRCTWRRVPGRRARG
jgi:hypothetical protein